MQAKQLAIESYSPPAFCRPESADQIVVRCLLETAPLPGQIQIREHLSGEALAMCRRITSQLEARVVTQLEWERAILTGFACWRDLVERRAGAVVGDLDARTMVVEEPSEADLSAHRAVCEREADLAAK